MNTQTTMTTMETATATKVLTRTAEDDDDDEEERKRLLISFTESTVDNEQTLLAVSTY